MIKTTTNTLKLFTLLSSLALGACGNDSDEHDHDDDDGHCHDGDEEECEGDENEVITTVLLNFTPQGGGAALSFAWNDADGEGGDSPVIDDVSLETGNYDLNIVFENRLEDPADDITAEIMEEDDEHQLFFTGEGVDGPTNTSSPVVISHDYNDMDGDGLPIGLSNTVAATAGTGQLIVTLRHLPPINDAAVKVESLTADVKSGGISALAGIGSSDASVTFEVTVTAP